jgi:hypothetical protein
MVLRLTGIAALLVVCACSGCRKAANEAMESAIESQIARDGGKANVQIADDNVSIKFQDEKGELRIAGGKDVALPEDFPKDVPLYSPMTVVMANSQKQDERFVIQATSADSLDQVAAFYKQEALKQGWEEESNTVVGADMRMLLYKKEGRSLQVMVAATDDGTTLTISTGKED